MRTAVDAIASQCGVKRARVRQWITWLDSYTDVAQGIGDWPRIDAQDARTEYLQLATQIDALAVKATEIAAQLRERASK